MAGWIKNVVHWLWDEILFCRVASWTNWLKMIMCLSYWYVIVTMEQSSDEMKNQDNKSLLMQVELKQLSVLKWKILLPKDIFVFGTCLNVFPSFVVFVLPFKCAGQQRRVQQLQVSRRTWVWCWAGWIKQTLSWLLLFILQSHNSSEILWATSRYRCCSSQECKSSTELSVCGCVLKSNLI